MLLPKERFKQFERKKKNPLFFDSYESDNWRYILFVEFYNEWNKKKNELNIEEIANNGNGQIIKNKEENNQLNIF